MYTFLIIEGINSFKKFTFDTSGDAKVRCYDLSDSEKCGPVLSLVLRDKVRLTKAELVKQNEDREKENKKKEKELLKIEKDKKIDKNKDKNKNKKKEKKKEKKERNEDDFDKGDNDFKDTEDFIIVSPYNLRSHQPIEPLTVLKSNVRIEVVYEDLKTGKLYWLCGHVEKEEDGNFFVVFDDKDEDWITENDEWQLCRHEYHPNPVPYLQL